MFNFKIVLVVVLLANQAWSQKNVKCGTPTPECKILPNGSIDKSATVKLSSGLVCDRTHKIYITKDFYACCQPKLAQDPEGSTTKSPRDEALTLIIERMKKVNAKMTECIAKKDDKCTINSLAQAAVVVTDAAETLGLLKH